jgi:hypothetical protein
MDRLRTIIYENLRLVVSNIHLRFEDNFVSQEDSCFNFGLTIDQVNYSLTNNNFERVFINVDERKSE